MGKVKGFTKQPNESVGFILWIIVVDIIRSGSKWWTDQNTAANVTKNYSDDAFTHKPLHLFFLALIYCTSSSFTQPSLLHIYSRYPLPNPDSWPHSDPVGVTRTLGSRQLAPASVWSHSRLREHRQAGLACQKGKKKTCLPPVCKERARQAAAEQQQQPNGLSRSFFISGLFKIQSN